MVYPYAESVRVNRYAREKAEYAGKFLKGLCLDKLAGAVRYDPAIRGILNDFFLRRDDATATLKLCYCLQT